MGIFQDYPCIIEAKIKDYQVGVIFKDIFLQTGYGIRYRISPHATVYDNNTGVGWLQSFLQLCRI